MSHGLNSAQLEAVRTRRGPLLVLAGAGTGKTRVITYRIAELIKGGIAPDRILAVTFTNKAAREMRERAQALLAKERGKGRKSSREPAPEISTFHSLCVRVLRRHARRLGYAENFTIYDRGDQESAARAALRDIRVGQQTLRPSDLITQISSWKGVGLTPEAAEQSAKSDAELLASAAYVRYQAKLRASSAMDFDDLLLLTEQLFVQHPEARFAEASRFDHLLIDEYQDTNALQYRIVKALADRHRNLCVVGDDDQSIYGWRGAEVAHILGFQTQWPDAKVVRLEENYRSTGWIIHLANTLVRHNKTRHDKTLVAARGRGEKPRFTRYEDETHEAESVVSEIRERTTRTDEQRVLASSIAILFRTNEQPRAFEQELRRHGVNYVLVGGQSFFDRKEVKDLTSYLKVLSNPHDEVALLRIINTPSRGIGTSTITFLLDQAVQAGVPLWTLLQGAAAHPEVGSGAAAGIQSFSRLIDRYRARSAAESLSAVVAELITEIDYNAEIERAHREPGEQESRRNAVQEFVSAVSNYERRTEQPTLAGFLEETMLSGREDQKDDDPRQADSVTLMTLHSAKGLEFPIVYMVGMEEGLLPHKRSVIEGLSGAEIEEERRLCYVGVTRAREELLLSLCKERTKWGKPRPQIPSRFLLEMRGETQKAEEAAKAAHEQLVRESGGSGREPGQPADKATDKARAKKGKRTKTARGEKPPSENRPRASAPKRLASKKSATVDPAPPDAAPPPPPTPAAAAPAEPAGPALPAQAAAAPATPTPAAPTPARQFTLFE
jgi:DNA helicase II / ATP-dependent DNA helicase PcrA